MPQRLVLALLALVALLGLRIDAGVVFAGEADDGLDPLPIRIGPIPDYAPIDSVWTHPQLHSIAPRLGPELDRVLGPRHRIEDYTPPAPEAQDPALAEDLELDPADLDDEEDSSLVWMRDYQPIYVRRPDGGIKVLRYLHENPNRSAYLPIGDAGADPFAPERLVESIDGPTFEWLPLLHENGNLVVAGRWVLVTDLLIEDNAADFDLPHLDAAGFVGQDDKAVVATLARALGRSPREIVVLPRMPGEQTGHVDLFVMAISDHVVIVPEIRREALTTADLNVDEALARDVRRFLDDVAARLRHLGLRVVRLPMVPPLVLEPVDDEEGMDAVFYSPANGLLLRTTESAEVLLPSVDLRDTAPGLAGLQKRYEREWVRVFAAHGWKARRVDATLLGRYLGLFRCVSQVVPAR